MKSISYDLYNEMDLSDIMNRYVSSDVMYEVGDKIVDIVMKNGIVYFIDTEEQC